MRQFSSIAKLANRFLAVSSAAIAVSYSADVASAQQIALSPFVGPYQGPGQLSCSTWTAKVGGNTDNGIALEAWAVGDLDGVYEGFEVSDTVILATTEDNFIGFITGYCASNPDAHLTDVVMRFFNSSARVAPKK